jgi:hypothetical protein
MSTEDQNAQQPSEEQLRQRLEEELRRVTVDDVLLQTAVSLINLGGRKAGLTPGTEGERDLDQVRSAIDGVQALLPLLERGGREEVRPIRDALAQLQLAFAKLAGEPAPQGPEREAAEPPKGKAGGPAQRSGRLWVPGQ